MANGDEKKYGGLISVNEKEAEVEILFRAYNDLQIFLAQHNSTPTKESNLYTGSELDDDLYM